MFIEGRVRDQHAPVQLERGDLIADDFHGIRYDRLDSSSQLLERLALDREHSGQIIFDITCIYFHLSFHLAPLAAKLRRWPLRHRGTKKLRRSEEHTSELQSRLHLVCRL